MSKVGASPLDGLVSAAALQLSLKSTQDETCHSVNLSAALEELRKDLQLIREEKRALEHQLQAMQMGVRGEETAEKVSTAHESQTIAQLRRELKASREETQRALQKLREVERDSRAICNAQSQELAELRMAKVPIAASGLVAPERSALGTEPAVVAESLFELVAQLERGVPRETELFRRYVSAVLASPAFASFCNIVDKSLE